MNKPVSKPIDILEKAFGYAKVYPWYSRHFKNKGKPGEIIEKLSAEDRLIIKELRSDDISETKLGKLIAWLGFDYSDLKVKELKSKFDKLMNCKKK